MNEFLAQLKAISNAYKTNLALEAAGIDANDVKSLNQTLEGVFMKLKEEMESLPIKNELNLNIKRCDYVILTSSRGKPYWEPVTSGELNTQDGLIWSIVDNNDMWQSGTSRPGHWANLYPDNEIIIPLEFSDVVERF